MASLIQQPQVAEAACLQNIDRLHQAAGSQQVIELHGSLWDLCYPTRYNISAVIFTPDLSKAVLDQASRAGPRQNFQLLAYPVCDQGCTLRLLHADEPALIWDAWLSGLATGHLRRSPGRTGGSHWCA